MFVARYTTDGALDRVEGLGSELDDGSGGIGIATATGEFRLSGMFRESPMMAGLTPLAPFHQVTWFLARFASDP